MLFLPAIFSIFNTETKRTIAAKAEEALTPINLVALRELQEKRTNQKRLMEMLFDSNAASANMAAANTTTVAKKKIG